jgi:hypothetical protein
VEYFPPRRREADSNAPGWGQWGWTTDSARRFPFLGVVLVLLGAALFVQQLDTRISFTGLVLLALGLAAAGAWLIGRSRWAMLPALALLALAAGRLGSDLGILVGNGWTTLLLGVALLFAWVIGRTYGRAPGWALWIGALLALIGLLQVADRITGIPELGYLWPVVLVAVGLILMFGNRINSRRRAP